MTPIYLLLEERSCLSVSTSDDNLGVIFPLGTFRRGHTGARFAPGQRDGCETGLTHNGRPAVWAGLSGTGHSVLSKDKGTEPREVRDLPRSPQGGAPPGHVLLVIVGLLSNAQVPHRCSEPRTCLMFIVEELRYGATKMTFH